MNSRIEEIKRLIDEYAAALANEIKNRVLKSDGSFKEAVDLLPDDKASDYALKLTTTSGQSYNIFFETNPDIKMACDKYEKLTELKKTLTEGNANLAPERLTETLTPETIETLTAKRRFFRARKGEALVDKMISALPLDHQLLRVINDYKNALAKEIRAAVNANNNLKFDLNLSNDAGIPDQEYGDKFIQCYPYKKDDHYLDVNDKLEQAGMKYKALIDLETALKKGELLDKARISSIKSELTTKRGFFTSKQGTDVANRMDNAIAENEARKNRK